ncbi:MAG: FAD-dependent oxidoreductase [Myxococcaceae bacterium]
MKCQMGCPVLTDAGRYVQLITQGRDEEAFLVARAPNPLASVCGRVCAAPCEDACRRGSIDLPISIRALKRFVTEQYGVESVRPDTQDQLKSALVTEGNRYPGHLPTRPLGEGGSRQKVAVVGAGPAGLSAAHDLALLGYEVTVFEGSSEPGGMLRFGIPEYRLPRALLKAEADKILALGVKLELGTALTDRFGLAELKRAGFEAVFLAVGVQQGRDLPLPGAELQGVVKAIDYLVKANRGAPPSLGRKVVVIGGGSVALDAARTALRAESDLRLSEVLDSARAAMRGGATQVTVVSLESLGEMPAARSAQGKEELHETVQEGITLMPRRGPKRILGEGKVSGIELRAVKSVFNAEGRFSPSYDEADLLTLECDGVILAVGQKADLSFLKPADGVSLSPGGFIQVDRETLATTAPGIFAGGDVAFGPRNLIDAVANGKLAARSMHRFLSEEKPKVESLLTIEKIPTRDYRMAAGFELLDRQAPPTLPTDRRTGIAEVESGYPPSDARAQGARCLVCHTQTIYDPELCILCGRCTDVCPEYCLYLVPFAELELDPQERAALEAAADPKGLPLSAMVKDDERCIRCGLCAVRCPTDAMTMEKFTITERFAPGEAHPPRSS